MKENLVILVDDKAEFKTQFENKFIEKEISCKLQYFKDIESCSNFLNKEPDTSIKFIIFDLCTLPGETVSKNFSVQPLIEKFYKEYKIVIFIHSAYINNFDLYSDEGTVFKMEKDFGTIDKICDIIKKMEQSNFCDLFCKNGIIENEFMFQIHQAFRKQFKGDEIIQIIDSIQSQNTERITEVFRRIAIKSLYHNLYNDTTLKEDSTIEDIKINAIENYYYRQNHYKFWTGDIFKKRQNDNFVIIVNPRCNIANNNVNKLLFCNVETLTPDQLKTFKKEENLRRGLSDDVKFTWLGDRYRFLPTTSKFIGGLIDFNSMSALNESEFLSDFSYQASISDELANEIVRKMSNYLMRGGVYLNDVKEELYYLNSTDGSN